MKKFFKFICDFALFVIASSTAELLTADVLKTDNFVIEVVIAVVLFALLEGVFEFGKYIFKRIKGQAVGFSKKEQLQHILIIGIVAVIGVGVYLIQSLF